MIFFGHDKMSTEFGALQKQKTYYWHLKLNMDKCSPLSTSKTVSAQTSLLQ